VTNQANVFQMAMQSARKTPTTIAARAGTVHGAALVAAAATSAAGTRENR
jgi:hypothetical protein